MMADLTELKLRIHHNLSPLSLVSVESSCCCCCCFKFKDPSSKATADVAAAVDAASDVAVVVVIVAPVCQGPFALLLPSNRTPFEMYKQYSKMKENAPSHHKMPM